MGLRKDLETRRLDFVGSTPPIPSAKDEIFLDSDAYDALAFTDWTFLSNWISQKIVQNQSEIYKLVGKNNFEDYDPKAIARVCNFLVFTHFEYDYELAKYEMGEIPATNFTSKQLKEMNDVDNLPVHKLLLRGKGVCRHMTLIAQSFYLTFKDMDKRKRLHESDLYLVTSEEPNLKQNLVYADLTKHAFLLILALADDNISLSIFDPTCEKNSSCATKSLGLNRLPQIINFLSDDYFFENFGRYFYSYDDLLTIVEKHIKLLKAAKISLDVFMSRKMIDEAKMSPQIRGLDISLSSYSLDKNEFALFFSSQRTSNKVGIVTGLFQIKEILLQRKKKNRVHSTGNSIKTLSSDDYFTANLAGANIGFEYIWSLAIESEKLKVSLGILEYLDEIHQPEWLLRVWEVCKREFSGIQNLEIKDLICKKFKDIYNKLFNASLQKANENFKFIKREHLVFLRDYEKTKLK